jgi:hypothetical protein
MVIGPQREMAYRKMKTTIENRIEELEQELAALSRRQNDDSERFAFVKEIKRLRRTLDEFYGNVTRKTFPQRWGKFYDSIPKVMGLKLARRRSSVQGDESDEEEPDHLPEGYYDVDAGDDYQCGNRPFRDLWERIAPKQKFSGLPNSTVRLQDIWDEFEPVHKAKNVPTRDKCRAFRMCLTGPAESTTNSFKHDNDATRYMRMVKEVFDRFGNANIEIQQLHRQLREDEPTGPSYDDLRDYILRIDENVRKLENINADPAAAMRTVWPNVVRAIPGNIWTEIRTLTREFARFKHSLPEQFYSKKPLVLFEAVKNHLLQNHRVFPSLRDDEDPGPQFASAALRTQPSSSDAGRRKPSDKTTPKRPEKRPLNSSFPCYVCNDTTHLALECTVPRADRLKLVLADNRCPGCLRPGHELSACKRKRICRLCATSEATSFAGAFHHPAVCPKGQNGPAKKTKLENTLKTVITMLADVNLEEASASDDDDTNAPKQL